MDKVQRLAKAVRGKKRRTGPAFVYGIFVASEAVDANLSQITIPGAGIDGADMLVRFVPKAEHVTGLVAPCTVLCVGSPLCIIAIVVGDITLAEV